MHWIPCTYETVHWLSKNVLAGSYQAWNPTDLVYVRIYGKYVLRIEFGRPLVPQPDHLPVVASRARRNKQTNNVPLARRVHDRLLAT